MLSDRSRRAVVRDDAADDSKLLRRPRRRRTLLLLTVLLCLAIVVAANCLIFTRSRPTAAAPAADAKDVWCAYPDGVGRLAPAVAGCVHVIRDFLPEETAHRLHSQLLEAWRRTFNGTADEAAAPGFHFTTNCRLTRSSCGSGGALRHDSLVAMHRARAEANRALGMYTMARHELDHAHAAHAEAIAHALDEAARERISRILGRRVRPNGTKHFITAFGPGDFLTTHTDVANGDAAFVLNLTPRWAAGMGGALTFRPSFVRSHPAAIKSGLSQAMAATAMNDDYAVAPLFNSLVVFVVEEGGPILPHEVTRVESDSDEPRLAVTGWVQLEGPRELTGLAPRPV